MDGSTILPTQVPVMPLPGALLFPHALLPLYIFEPRYREMLEHALNHHRMFSVALIKPQSADWQSPQDFFHIAGVGLIRACVGRGDGTSNLILQGLERVRFTSFEQEAPFPIATIDPLESDAVSSVETEALAAKVLELYSKFKGNGRQLPAKVDRYLSDLGDPEMLADLVASTFISDPLRRQDVLEELSVNQRLRLVIRYLSEEGGTAGSVGGNGGVE
jgi:Lon protease-like protein